MTEPGQTCETCGRRMPHPRKQDSPDTKVKSYRIPVDETEAHLDVLEVAAKFMGTFERPHWQFWTFTYALAHVLQDEGMRGIGQREAA